MPCETKNKSNQNTKALGAFYVFNIENTIRQK